MHIDTNGKLDPETAEKVRAWYKDPTLPNPVTLEEVAAWSAQVPILTPEERAVARASLLSAFEEFLELPPGSLSDRPMNSPVCIGKEFHDLLRD